MTPPLPPQVRLEVEAALGRIVGSGRIRGASAVTGGSINAAARLEADDGTAWFLKWNSAANPAFFEIEADGLRALRAAAAESIVVPEPLAIGTGDEGGPPWLLLPFLERGPLDSGWEEALGRGIAELHRLPPVHLADRFGWHRDNVIGSLPQANTPTSDWAEFWRDRRMGPQLRAAREQGWFAGRSGAGLMRLMDRMDEALAGTASEPPSLLHGDLWGGNVFGTADGRAVLVDPAVYLGHREVDLAMSELFGFPRGFLPAYHEAWPIPEEYAAFRRDLYQLYYLLVHVNLFGAGYVEGSIRAADRVLAAL